MTRVALLCGNGLSIDRATDAGLALDPSSPLAWPVPHPDSDELLIAALPKLQGWLQNALKTSPNHFQIISSLTAGSKGTKGPWEWDCFDVHSELRHFLTLAYSWYQAQLDRSDPSEWAWHRWLKRNHGSLVGALSLNYDLVLERSLYWNRVPFFYPGTDGRPIGLPRRGIARSPSIALAKPHGSCNFGSQLRMSPVGYPLPTHTWAGDAALRILDDAELPRARDLADIVTPGEWNVFLQYLTWARMMHRAFRQILVASDVLVIVGFSFGTPDQGEFGTLLSYIDPRHRIIVADPQPSTSLLDYLRDRRISPELWLSGPQDLS